MTSAFFSMSVASFALALGLAQGLAQLAPSRIGLALLGLWGVGVLIAMIFPLDPEGAPQTMSGIIHRIDGPLAFLSLTAGMILISRRFEHNEAWRPVHRLALSMSLIMLAAFIATSLSISTGLGFAGVGQRIGLATAVTWFLLVTAHLRLVALKSLPV